MRFGTLVITALLLTGALSAQEDVLRPNGRPGGGSRSTSSSKGLPFVLGIEAGANFNFFGQSIASDPVIDNSPERALESGFGVSSEFGVFTDIGLSKTIGLQFRLAYDAKSATGSADGFIDASDDEGFFSGQIPVTAEHSLSSQNLAIALLLRADLVDQLFLTFGPIMHVGIGDVTRTDKLTKTNESDTWIRVNYEGVPGEYDEIERETTVAQNLLPDELGATVPASYATTRFGLELGLGYRFDLSPTIYLAPNLRYQLMLTPLNGEFSAADVSQTITQSVAALSYDASSLNTLALIIQLGFSL